MLTSTFTRQLSLPGEVKFCAFCTFIVKAESRWLRVMSVIVRRCAPLGTELKGNQVSVVAGSGEGGVKSRRAIGGELRHCVTPGAQRRLSTQWNGHPACGWTALRWPRWHARCEIASATPKGCRSSRCR